MRHLGFLLSIFCSLSIFAQTQKGYVRSAGTVYSSGHRLNKTFIKANGKVNETMSNDNGEFLLSVECHKDGEGFTLHKVQKDDYELLDKDFLTKRHAYSSKTPFEIVLISSKELLKEKQDVESVVYKQVEEKYNGIIATLNKELAAGRLSENDYQQRLKQVQTQYDTFEPLIAEMAEHYARTDFDALDSLDREINRNIIEGNVIQADFLLASKGDITERIKIYQRHVETNEKARLLLDSLTFELHEKRVAYEREREDISNDLYHKYTIALSRFDLDSAQVYIDLRADLDTMNIRWTIDAASYHLYRSADYDKAIKLYGRAIKQSNSEHKGWNQLSTYLLSYLAKCCEGKGDVQNAHAIYSQMVNVYTKVKGENTKEIAEAYSSFAVFLMNYGEYSLAEEHLLAAKKIKDKLYSEDDVEMMRLTNNLGMLYWYQKQYDKSIEYLKKSVLIYQAHFTRDSKELANVYNNLGMAYSEKGDTINALSYLMDALNMRKRIWGPVHGDIANSYNNLGSYYSKCKDYERALFYHNEALQIREKLFGSQHVDFAQSLGNIASVYDLQNDFRCAKFYWDALKIYWQSPMLKNNDIVKNIATKFYGSYCNAVKRGIDLGLDAEFQEFCNHYVVSLTVIENETSPAYQQGMRGMYFVLKIEDWELQQPRTFFDVIASLRGKPKQVVLFDDSGFTSKNFKDKIGGNLELYYIDHGDKLHQDYLEWLKNRE